MRQLILTIFLGQLLLSSCNLNSAENKDSLGNEAKESTIIEIADSGSTPTVELSNYKLIVDSSKDRKSDAEEILRVKRKWPLAMQSKSRAEFDSILSKNFIFKGPDSFYNRNDYINDRTSPDEWIITFVKYENVTLQFVGNSGILSYKNHITNKNVETGEIEYEHITWIDIYMVEDGKWKIAAAHAIDYRLELPTK